MVSCVRSVELVCGDAAGEGVRDDSVDGVLDRVVLRKRPSGPRGGSGL